MVIKLSGVQFGLLNVLGPISSPSKSGCYASCVAELIDIFESTIFGENVTFGMPPFL